MDKPNDYVETQVTEIVPKDVRELAGRISAIFNDWNSDIGRLNEVATEIERTFRVRLALAREHGDVRTRQGIIELALSAERDAATAHAKLAEQARDDWKYRHDSLDAQGFELARKLEIAERKGEEIRAAATKALRKLRAYVGVCSGDKELTQSIIPSLEEALATLEPKYFGPSIIGPDGVEQIGPALATPAEGTTAALALGMDKPWPMRDCVVRLCEAADILLDRKSYDGHGHEEIATARNTARELLAAEGTTGEGEADIPPCPQCGKPAHGSMQMVYGCGDGNCDESVRGWTKPEWIEHCALAHEAPGGKA